jgi:hypothetical protein
MTTEQVTGTAVQWGAYITLSDVDDLVLFHPAMQKATELLGKNAAEVIDREVQKTLQGSTNIQYGYNKSGRFVITGATGGSDVLNTTNLAVTVANLEINGAEKFDGINYVGAIDPAVKTDIMLESKFLNAAQYSNITALFKGELGTWMGVRWIQSNFMQKWYGAGDTVVTGALSGSMTTGTYFTVCVGKDPVYGMEQAITCSVTGTGIAAVTGSIYVTPPSTPTGYLWDIYIGTTGAIKLTASGQGITGGTNTQILTAGTGATAPSQVATGLTVRQVWVFGKGAFGVVDLTGIVRTLTPSGESKSDPLNQRRYTGWKAFFAAIILNDNFMRRIEVVSDYDG